MDGESVFSLADRYAPGGTPLARTLQISSDQKMVSLDLDVVADLLYKDCTPADVAYAKANLKPGPTSILATPARLGSTYASIPKFYILCTEAKDMDKSELARNITTEKVFSINTSHSPFLSAPDRLAKILDEIATFKGR